MKKFKIALLALALMCVPLFAFVSTSFARGTSNNDSDVVVINEKDPVNHAVYVAGSKVEIHGKINGDIFCAGSSVVIDADVTGDIFCAGQSLTIKGAIDGSVRAAGSNVQFDATVSRSATLAGSVVTLGKDSKVDVDLTVMSSDASLEGVVGRDATVSGASFTLDGTVGRHLSAEGDSITLASKAVVKGNVNYVSSKELTKTQGAVVTGDITYSKPEDHPGEGPSALIAKKIGAIAMFLTLALLVAGFFPRLFKKASTLTQKQPLSVAITGIVAGIVLPVLVVASFVLSALLSGATLLVGFGLLFAWILAMILSIPFAGHYFGEMILMRAKSVHPALAATVGVAAITIPLLIPMLGGFILFLSGVFGMGIIVNTILKTRLAKK